ncbi:Serine protease family s09a, partial [Globisporangium splendens]
MVAGIFAAMALGARGQARSVRASVLRPLLVTRYANTPTTAVASALSNAHWNGSAAIVRSISTTKKHDSWQWLKDPENLRLQQFLKMERGYLSHQISKPRFRKIERAFYMEFRARVLRADATIPERIGSYEYYMRQSPGENYQVYYRRHRLTQVEETVLNQNVETNVLGVAQQFHFVTAMKISQDENAMLIVMENENEECRAMIKDLKTQRITLLPNVKNVRNAEWSNVPRKQCFYYTKVDAHRRPYAVYRYDCDRQTQELIYEEQDDGFFVDVSQTKDGEYVLINCNSKNTSEIYALSTHDEKATPQLLRRREPNTAYFADHANDRFYVVTNADKAQNYKIVSPRESSHHESWETILPESQDVKIEDVDLFKDYLVLYERVQSVPRIRVCKLSNPRENSHFIPLPREHEICRISPGVNRDYTSHSVRFSISTPLVPEIVYDYDMQAKKLCILKEVSADTPTKKKSNGRSSQPYSKKHKENSDKLPFTPELYTCERVYVPSTSNLDVQVPMTLIHRRDIERNGQNPTLLLGYGAYGTNLEADFELEHLSLLERGWVIALAHARGGGELGLQWYHDGKGLNKRNTFDDYLSCANHLLDQQYTNPKRLAGKGVSAGGLVMGYMANEYPSLFQAMIMKVPFLDILETMQDPSLPLTVHEYEEWGNPNDPKVYDYIKSYAPCENMRPGHVYPSMFITGGMNDQRVQFWEPVKWVYKLRQLQAKQPGNEKRLLLLKLSEDEGHFGGGGRLEQLQENAMEMAFLYQALKLPFP